MSARFEKGGRGTKKTKPEPARTSLGFLEMRHVENTGRKRGGRWAEKERASCDARDGEEKRGEGRERGTEGSERGKERERQICRMTTMTMTRRSRRFHFLYRDRDVRELQKKRI